MAKALADGPVAALSATRALLYDGFGASLETQLDRELRSMVTAGGAAECEEGLAALIEKRDPNFR